MRNVSVQRLSTVWLCLLALCSMAGLVHSNALAFQEGQQSKKETWRQHKLGELSKLSAPDLFKTFQSARNAFPDDKVLTHDMVLTEMVRRSSKECESFLLAKLKDVNGKSKNPEEQWPSLELVTALRRIQKLPDPVALEVTLPKELRATTRELPSFAVRLKNVDAQKQPVFFQFGGDYRSGRLARWAFEVHDSSKRLMAPRKWEADWEGGMAVIGPLEFGEEWKTTLPMGKYVRLDEPGEYSVRILYHGWQTIADLDDLAGLICCASPVFKLTVAKPNP